MSVVTTYNYNCSFNFNMTVNAPLNITSDNVQATLQPQMAQVAAQKFADGFAQTSGHWFKVNSTTVQVSSLQQIARREDAFIKGLYTFSVVGTCTTNVDTDIADPKKELSPQNWWTIFLGVVAAIGLALVGLTVYGAIVLAIVALVALGESLVNTVTGAIMTLGSNIGSLVIVLGVLAVAGLATYALFFTRTGGKAASKGYQVARRTYKRARAATRRS